jgi:hypothetical protein
MTTLNLKKYDEVEFTFIPGQQILEIKAPWMNIEFETDSENQERVLKTVDLFSKLTQNTEISEEEQNNINWLLSFAYDFPVSNVMARKHLAPSISSSLPCTKLSSWLSLSPSAASSYINSDSTRLRLPEQWNWNADEVLKNAKLGENSYDPLSIYTGTRLLRLRSETAAKSNFNWYNELESLLNIDEDVFVKMSQFALRQTHYITKQCVPSLTPAVNKFPEACSEVTEFIREEKGHDRLVLKSLMALGCHNPDDIELLDETKMSMEALRFSAEVSPLAFASLIGIFEGSSYTDKDPMASVLERSPYPEAAEGIQIHFEINRDHNHSCVGTDMASKLGSVSYEQALATIRLSELVVLLGNELTARLQERIQLFKKAL